MVSGLARDFTLGIRDFLYDLYFDAIFANPTPVAVRSAELGNQEQEEDKRLKQCTKKALHFANTYRTDGEYNL
jgi:hypothetical protein